MRILLAGANYAPETTSVAPYTTGLAEHLACQGHDVVVATSFPFYPLWRWYEPPPRWRTRQRLNGVDVWRTKIILPTRRTATRRVLFDTSIAFASAVTALSIPKVNVTICLSPPIQTTLIGAAIRFKLGKLVTLVKDLPTEAARSVGMLHGGAALHVGRAIEQSAYRLADHVVVISGAFSAYIQRLGVSSEKISEIPDWADLESIRPAKPDPRTRLRLGAGPKDVLILHTGNMGAKQDLSNVVDAAALVTTERRIRLVLIGDGPDRLKIAERIAAQNLKNITMLPVQESSEFPGVLCAADMLLINQAPDVIDSVLPSKLLAYMASGRPVLAAVHPMSTTASIVQEAGCGLIVEAGRPQVLAAAIRKIAAEAANLPSMTAMGQRGRAYAEAHYDRGAVFGQWDALLARIVST